MGPDLNKDGNLKKDGALRVSWNRSLAVAWRIALQFRRDHRTLALLFIVPVAIMSLVGYLIGGPAEPVRVGITVEDQGLATPAGTLNLGKAIPPALAGSEDLITETVPDEAAGRDAVRRGDLQGLLVVPRDFTRQLAGEGPARLQVILRGTDPGSSGAVGRALAGSMDRIRAGIEEELQKAFRDGGRSGSPGSIPSGNPVVLEMVELFGGGRLKSIDLFAPAFITGFVFFFTFLLTSVSFLRERASGTMERLAASPAGRIELVLGYVLGFAGFATVQGLVVLGYSVWILDVTVAGSPALVLLILVLLVVGAVNLGITLSFFARNELQVVQFIPMVITPQFFLAGLFWPLETITPYLRWLGYLMPMTYATEGLRAVMLRGEGLSAVAGEIAFLAAFAVGAVGLGALVLRRGTA
ncbi:MAG: ABC transporter permease [Firmicutes bacterium]|nr:ABC transporter permease [Bacillota bacterium]